MELALADFCLSLWCLLVRMTLTTAAATTATAATDPPTMARVRRRRACWARRSSCRSSLRLAVARRCSLVGTADIPPYSRAGSGRVCQPGLNKGGATRPRSRRWETGQRVDHRISCWVAAVQLLRAGAAPRSGCHHRRPWPACDGPVAAHPGQESADACRGAAHPRPYRPHLVRAEGLRHVRLPRIHPSGRPVHADRPDQGLRAEAGPAAARARSSASPNRSSNWTETPTRSTSAGSASPSTTRPATPGDRWSSGSRTP